MLTLSEHCVVLDRGLLPCFNIFGLMQHTVGFGKLVASILYL